MGRRGKGTRKSLGRGLLTLKERRARRSLAGRGGQTTAERVGAGGFGVFSPFPLPLPQLDFAPPLPLFQATKTLQLPHPTNTQQPLR